MVALGGLCGVATASPAAASTATEIGTLPTLDGLTRNETPLSNGGKWAALSWDLAIMNKTGQDTTSGWGPQQAFPQIHGAYWTPTSFSDAGSGDAAMLTMQKYPEIEDRYVSVWLNMPSPGSVKSGYQLSWTLNEGLTTYTVELSKWASGTETVLASNAAVSIPNGTAMAISDTGGTVTAWKGSGGSVSSLLSAEDSAYSSGYAGIEGSGNLSRSTEFRAGALLGGSITGVSILDDLLRSEAPMVPGKWAKTSWAAEIGSAWNSGYLGYGSTHGGTYISSAYWTPASFSDAGAGVLVAATVGTGLAEAGEYMAIWLNMPLPGSIRAGYEARFTAVGGGTSEYNVEISKWVLGRTVLASGSKVSIPPGTTYALTDVSGRLTLWTGSGSFAPVLSTSDSTYSDGYAGLETYGPDGTEYNFRVGTPAVGVPPSKPSVTSVVPASPANNNSPSLIGSATAGSTVQLFTNSSCSGSAVASGSAAAFGSTGIASSVANNSTTTFYAKATNGTGSSPCSTTSVIYVEDSIAPSTPTVSSTSPVSGSNNNAPKVVGSAESGLTVKLYTNATCTSAVAASGTAAAFGPPGLTVSVADNTTTVFRATATDAAGNVSPCSTTSVTYVEATPKVYWGAWISGNVYGTPEEYGDGPWDPNTWNLFEEHAGKQISMEHFGQPAPWNQAFAEGPLKAIRGRGAIPVMDMDPDGAPLKEIAEGKKDSDFVSWAKAVKAWGYPMMLRWSWEMNGTWFQVGKEAAANPTLYKEVWWHLHDLIEEQGASNVTWVWCPNLTFPGSTSLSSLYPAKESEGKGKYVDWTCLDGYNFGTNPAEPDSWKSFSTLYTSSYNELLSLAPTKPIMIGEVASTEFGGSKASWITDAIGTQIPKNFPKIKAVLWFNKWEEGMDWPIETSASSESAFAGAIASTYYAGNTFGSLPALTKIEPLP
ncbi:MAG TPA: glycosyl hydrolase [Solirubrobacterales bacterium]|nr:glycosyl hydrolase [Solirubrobacterales bacterium]